MKRTLQPSEVIAQLVTETRNNSRDHTLILVPEPTEPMFQLRTMQIFMQQLEYVSLFTW